MMDAVARKRCEIFFALARLDPSPPPPIPGETELVGVVPFVFSSGTMVLGSVPEGYKFNRAAILIETPFTDPSATIRLGTSADLSLLLGADDTTPTAEGQYESDALVVIDVARRRCFLAVGCARVVSRSSVTDHRRDELGHFRHPAVGDLVTGTAIAGDVRRERVFGADCGRGADLPHR